jgi:DnaJ-class molecular chaperone
MTVLEEKQIQRAHNFFIQVRSQNPEWFEKNDIEKCERCDGTGLSVTKLATGGYSWDTMNYCDECRKLIYGEIH